MRGAFAHDCAARPFRGRAAVRIEPEGAVDHGANAELPPSEIGELQIDGPAMLSHLYKFRRGGDTASRNRQYPPGCDRGAASGVKGADHDRALHQPLK
jgi:hypothetical protein